MYEVNARRFYERILWPMFLGLQKQEKTMTESFQVECAFCRGKFILDQEPDANWQCICRNKPKPWSILNHCSNGHTSWLKNMNGDCEECKKQKTIKTAKKLLAIQSDPKRQALEQSIVRTDQIIRDKKEQLLRRKMQIDDAIITTPILLKELIESVNSMSKDEQNSEKIDELTSKLNQLESKFE